MKRNTLFLLPVLLGLNLVGCGSGGTDTTSLPGTSLQAANSNTDTALVATTANDAIDRRDSKTTSGTSQSKASTGVTPTLLGTGPKSTVALAEPTVGSNAITILSPTTIELSLVTTEPVGGPPTQWNFAATTGGALPSPGAFQILVNGTAYTPTEVGFKRRVLYAPENKRDLRIGNWLYLQLGIPVPANAVVQVLNPGGAYWPTSMVFSGKASGSRFNPAIHVNQLGYAPTLPKQAQVGYYMGTMGELPVGAGATFWVVNSTTGQVAFTGTLSTRGDSGWSTTLKPGYQHVLQADFSSLATPGEYYLQVENMGASYPFVIADGVTAAVARNYALGMYHQRCGTALTLPFTRFIHAACHTAPCAIPSMATIWNEVNSVLAGMTVDWSNTNGITTGPQLSSVAKALYQYVIQTPVDEAGGHHDAGDYSKYVIDSAKLVHHLIFAVDNFPGVAKLDNMGIPESGDGISDLMQEAKWESDFIAKMQDADGGFYFLVYPQQEKYEDKMPDKGDPQCVFPKTTVTTACSVAALADMAGSPAFKAAYPAVAAEYLAKAKLGWQFLQAAFAQHGYYGSYQKINSYGTDFLHDDEVAWAASALYTATGDPQYQSWLLSHFNPNDPNTIYWGWIHMAESYGAAMRDYAFAASSGKLPASALDATFLAGCKTQINNAAQDQLTWSQGSAYGLGLSYPTKRSMNPGWYFANSGPFDLTVAYQLNPNPAYLAAVVQNVNYELGSNPVNVSFQAGLGWKRPQNMVSQVAETDGLSLPPSGWVMGCLQTEFENLSPYNTELKTLSFPSDSDPSAPYALMDRYGDSWNVTTECTTDQVARCLASLAFLMAQSSTASQSWQSATASISGLPASMTKGQQVTVSLNVPTTYHGLSARVVWESYSNQPVIVSNNNTFTYTANATGAAWIQAEAQLEDGRRVFAIANTTVQ